MKVVSRFSLSLHMNGFLKISAPTTHEHTQTRDIVFFFQRFLRINIFFPKNFLPNKQKKHVAFFTALCVHLVEMALLRPICRRRSVV